MPWLKDRVQAYVTTPAIKKRLDTNAYYAVQSEVAQGTIIIRTPEEWAIVQNALTVRLPAKLVKEMAEILKS